MLVLGIDTSSVVASIAIATEDKILGEFTINHPKTHSQKLMPMVDQLLKNLELTVKDLDLIAITVGPGSFTGVRIGISIAKGFAQAYNIPVVEISGVEGLAYNIQHFGGVICPIMDARRNQVYSGVYKWNDGNLDEVVKEDAYNLDVMIEILKEKTEGYHDKRVIFVGDGVAVHKEVIAEKLGSKAVFANAANVLQRGSSVALLGSQNREKAKSYDDVHANYLRKSQAEREYDERQAK